MDNNKSAWKDKIAKEIAYMEYEYLNLRNKKLKLEITLLESSMDYHRVLSALKDPEPTKTTMRTK